VAAARASRKSRFLACASSIDFAGSILIRDFAFELGVLRQEHFAHAARAQLFQ